ncbi:MAG: hypothetical protein HXS46_03935, partial [Theionarchaea archaeon]|nr:hypothetical protein [Theionarchaea archaeon]
QRIDLNTFLYKDAVLPLINIVIASILKYDIDTTRKGMEIIGDRICYILANENISDEQDRGVSRKMNEYISNIGELAEDIDQKVSIIQKTTLHYLNVIEREARKNYHRCEPEGDTEWLEIAKKTRNFLNIPS